MTELADFATALIAAHRNETRFAPPQSALSRSDILAVQATVSAALGEVAGFKVGRQPEGPPILAPIPQCYEVTDGGDRPVLDRLGVELEIGFEVIRDLPGGTFPSQPEKYFRPRTMLELVDTRLTGPEAQRADLKFADLQVNAGLVRGSAPFEWDGSDFGTVQARLVAGSQVVLDGDATVPGGSALANLELLVSHLGDHCGGLKVGQIVLTGSISGLPYFGPGTDVVGEISGLGRVAVNLR